MDAGTLKGRLESLAHVITVSASAIYICGFVVLSVNHALLGLPQLNLLRPRILSAGILLIVFAGVPTLETLRVAEVRQFASFAPNVPEKYRAAILMLPSLFLAMAVTACLFRGLLVGSFFTPGTHDGWIASGLLPLVGVISALDVWRAGVRVRIIAFIAVFAWFMFCVYRSLDHTLWSLTLWFSWCAYSAIRIYGPLEKTERLLTINLFQAVVATVATFGIFADYVYPRIPALMGGGEPLPATLSFVLQDKQPPVGSSQQQKVWMLDETDAGFYFLQSKDAKKAVFVPRSEVSAIYFGE